MDPGAQLDIHQGGGAKANSSRGVIFIFGSILFSLVQIFVGKIINLYFRGKFYFWQFSVIGNLKSLF